MSTAPAPARTLCAGCMSQVSTTVCPRCGWDDGEHPELQLSLPRHHILAGRYYLGNVLGQGGFGITYLGWDLKLSRKVAVKEYFPTDQCTRLADRTTIHPYSGGKSDQYAYGLSRFL